MKGYREVQSWTSFFMGIIQLISSGMSG